MLSLGVIPCQYCHKWYIVKNYIPWPTFLPQKVSVYLQPLLRNPPRKLPNLVKLSSRCLLRRSWSFKVTDFGTNRKIICDFLLVINTNLVSILQRFRDIALERSKIAIFGYTSLV